MKHTFKTTQVVFHFCGFLKKAHKVAQQNYGHQTNKSGSLQVIGITGVFSSLCLIFIFFSYHHVFVIRKESESFSLK